MSQVPQLSQLGCKFFDSDTETLKIFNGTAFVDLREELLDQIQMLEHKLRSTRGIVQNDYLLVYTPGSEDEMAEAVRNTNASMFEIQRELQILMGAIREYYVDLYKHRHGVTFEPYRRV